MTFTTLKRSVGGGAIHLPPTRCPKDDILYKCGHTVRLTDVPEHDLCGIRVVDGSLGLHPDAPELLGMSLQIGAQRCLYWDRAALESGKELLGLVLCEDSRRIPTSLAYHMFTELVFHYDAYLLGTRATWEHIHRLKKNLVEEAFEELDVVALGTAVDVPEIEISFARSVFAKDAAVDVEFWERLPSCFEPTFEPLMGKRESEDGTQYAKNAIRFRAGTAMRWPAYRPS